jgi:hypothetical protein
VSLTVLSRDFFLFMCGHRTYHNLTDSFCAWFSIFVLVNLLSCIVPVSLYIDLHYTQEKCCYMIMEHYAIPSGTFVDINQSL